MVVVTDQSTTEAIRIDNFCHSHNIAFVRAEIRGVFASLFCDFGSSFTVFDTDGEGLPSTVECCVQLLRS